MSKIAISYRRADSEAITGRIFDRLAAHFGRESVFRDIDSVPLGIDFRDHVAAVLADANIMLVVVGPRWMGRRGGQSRLDDPTDLVRVEIETALGKSIPIIPIWTGRTGTVKAEQLPESLKDLVYRNGIRVDSGQDFDAQLDRLIHAIDGILVNKKSPAAVVAEAHKGENATDVEIVGNDNANASEPVATAAPKENQTEIFLAETLPLTEAEDIRRPTTVPVSDSRSIALETNQADLSPEPETYDANASTDRHKWIDTAPHPWRRLFARYTDYVMIIILLSWFFLVIKELDESEELADSINQFMNNDFAVFAVGVALSTPLNAILIGLSGGTFGKWLFGVRILRDDRGKIGIWQAFYRELLVVVRGLGFGIPIVSLFTEITAYNKLKKLGTTSWDAKLSTTVVYRSRGLRQNILSAVGGTLFMGLIVAGIVGSVSNVNLSDCTRRYNNKDFNAAMRACRKVADEGSAVAQTAVGLMYEGGKGVTKNEEQALAWYRKAADQGDATAENQIGILYLSGSSVKQDDAQAMSWFRKAADHGSAVAQQNVAWMFENGRGVVSKDLAQARLWYEKAAANGNKDAIKWLADHKPAQN